jgi:hypothetical protein
VVIALAVSLLTDESALASDKRDIVALLKQWISGEAGTVATCADDAAVIDDIPPFEWHGPGACARWRKDNQAYGQKEGVTEPSGTIGEPQQLMISGDRAYVVVPSTFSQTQKGKRTKEIATSTLVLQKTAAGWRITAWTWGTHSIQ